jgi:hypothetical protein
VTNAWYQQSCFVINILCSRNKIYASLYCLQCCKAKCHLPQQMKSYHLPEQMKKNHVIAHPLTLGGKTYLRKLVYKPIDSVVQKDQLSFLCWASLAKFELPFLPILGSVQFFCCLFRFPLLVCMVIQLFRCFFFLNKILTVGASPAVFAVKNRWKWIMLSPTR